MDHFSAPFPVGTQVTIRLSDSPPMQAKVFDVERHEYSEFLQQMKGVQGYVRYLVRWGPKDRQTAWLTDTYVSEGAR